MSIVVDEETKLVISGLTGREGSFHGLRNRDYGTDLVAGVTPGKGGQEVDGVPVFDKIADAVGERGANTSMIFVPARFAAAAIEEAVEAGIGTVIAITEGIPVLDMLRV
jgi:succinyl-CoA synthetase alpha subunit